MAPIKAEYTTISGKNQKLQVEVDRQFDLGRQQGERAFVKLLGLSAGGIAIPHNNWDGEPGEPVTIKRGEKKSFISIPGQALLMKIREMIKD